MLPSPFSREICTNSMMLSPPFILYLYFLAPCYWAFICQNMEPSSEFSMDGDYTIAGFFRLHSYSTTVKSRPEVDICDSAASVNSHGYHLFQAMRFAIEKINNSSSLLPNVTLGYEIYNTCSESANMYATLSILAQSRQHHVEVLSNFTHYQPKAVALIGPDSSQFTLTTAAILSILLMPEISYEASNEMLSLKRAYPSFLRTIPSDRLQVEAVVLLLQEFGWNWIAMVGSDDAYGRNGIKTLQEVVAKHDICAAYQGIIPTKRGASSPELKRMVRVLVGTGVNVTVVFSNVDSAKDLFDMVVQENVTEKVWLGTEAWSLASEVWSIPGIHRIGTVIGLSVKQAKLPGLEEFESAHLLEKIKQVNFTLQKSQVHFDTNGDPLTGYDLVVWKWTGQTWSFDVFGSYVQNPDRLNIGQDGFLWHTKDNQVPVSTCSKVCVKGEKRMQVGLHQCCFDCVACPTGTFLNSSDLYNCQPCGTDQWAPVGSEICFNRTIEFLSWADPVSWALLTGITLLLLLLAGTAALFAQNLTTPVVKSAGGRMCFLMLGALICACCSLYCYFGEPTWHTCLLRLPVFSISFTICLSCIATRAFQIICIFKLASKWPAFYRAWMRHNGPNLFIGACTAGQLVMCLVSLSTNPSVPRKDYKTFVTLIIFQCSEDDAVWVLLYNILLSICCFVISYMGKDLPENYNEAKCITCSLLINFVCFICFLTTYVFYQGKYLVAITVLSNLTTLSGIFGGYFLPKGYIILFRAQLNTTEHFQMSIQSYTTKKSSD
ncbi:taste receptor type 1 member 1 isoform X3 [Trachemys scripta elegans]|uniref:taste receptor type 1 member 1 isoform X3 n=1 Tax=Trachemys scripta elegans TaxID=31138 RepID=UPI0015544D38|nr:taste receptor type 1 member 1 isoform X3 [Trachemys scripta elegans]